LKQTADIVSRRAQGNILQEVQGHVEHRPTWSNIKISRLMEKSIKASIEMSSRSHLSPYSSMSPANFFDPWVFLQILHNLDADSDPTHTALPRTHSLASLDSDIEYRVMKDDDRSKALPIDEHEATIVETISRQRVTIVEGETGCGKVS
jgi:HrpA-like RNA helicase